MVVHSDSEKASIQVWISEFEGLRNLVLNFQRMQHNLIWVNISILGAIITIYYAYWQDKSDMTLFLIIPIVSGLLGIYWVSQGRQTAQIGHYIEGKIAPALKKLCHSRNIMGYETYIRSGMKEGALYLIFDAICLRIPRAIAGVTFVVSSIIGLVITGINLAKTLLCFNEWQVAFLWWVGLIITLYLISSGIYLGYYWRKVGKKKS